MIRKKVYGLILLFAIFSVQSGYSQVFNAEINASDDDAYETSGTTMSVSANYLSVGYDLYYIGLRFQNVTIPQGSTINSATFSAYYYTTQAGITVNIYGQDIDNATVFTTTSGNISGRTATTANVNWPFDIASSTWNTSPSIISIIQEIVNRPGWASGNAICIITKENGTTNFGKWEAWDYSGTNHATITINYTPPTTRDYSGTVYSDEGLTTIADGTNLRIRVNGTDGGTTTTSSGDYAFTSITVAPDDVVQVYIDGEAGVYGCVTTVVDAIGNIINLNVYQNYIIVRNDNAGITTNTDLAVYDGDDDTDIKYTSNAGTLDVLAGAMLYTGNNFTPGGDVNIADSLIVKNGTFLVNGGFDLNMINSGITPGVNKYVIDVRSGGILKLDDAASQITRTDVDADIVIQSGGELNISNGTMTGFDYHQIEGAFNISNGALTTHNASGLGRIKFTETSSGSQTGGTITFNTLLWALVGTTWNATAGLIQTNGSGISNEASIYINELSFYINDLTIDKTGVSDGFAKQNSVTASDLDIRGNLIISASCTLNSNGKPVTITGNWTNNGTYTSGTNTVTFNATSTINTGGIANHNFYNVILNGTSAELAGDIDINNDFTLTNGTWNVYSGGLFYDMYVEGEWINNATFNCLGDVLNVFDNFQDGDYTGNPTWNKQSGDWTIYDDNPSGTLCLRGIDGVNDESISTESNQAYGSWEFRYSFEVATTDAYVRFFIIMTPDHSDPKNATTDGYYIWVDGGGTTDDFELRRIDNGVPTTLITYDWIPGTAWHTVKVTRNMNNQFEVFYDGSSIGTITDATYTSSAYMGIWTTGNIANDDHKIDDIQKVGMGGTVTFDGNVTQYVQGNSITTFNNLTINNSDVDVDDGVIMQQSFNVFNTLSMSDGCIDMGNYNIYLKTSGVLSGETNANRIFTSGTQTGEISATRPLNAPSSVNMAGLGAVITDIANLGATTLERGHKAQTIDTYTSTERYYDISAGSPTSATLEFYFFSSELNGQTPGALMKLYKSIDVGVNWTEEGGTWTDGTPDDDVTLSGITGFSRWTVSDKQVVLPIELISFTGLCKDGISYLQWITASEINNDYFTVERCTTPKDESIEGSKNNDGWKTPAVVKGAGNSNIIKYYSYTDQHETLNLKPETILYYRLKQTDFDGKYSYSDIIAVNCNKNENTSFEIIKILNNNGEGNVAILFNSLYEEKISLKIYDIYGRLLSSEDSYINEDMNILITDFRKYSSGIYLLVLQNGDRFTAEKIIRSK